MKFELHRVRDFGEIINDSFAFFKDNFKPLMKPLLIICGFFILLGTVSYAFMQTSMLNFVSSNMNGQAGPGTFNNTPYSDPSYIAGTLLWYICLIFYMLSVYLITYSYIAIYKDKPNGEKPTLEEVWGYYKYYFLRALGSSILTGIVVGIGTILCILPGIYLFTVLILLLPIMIMENGSFSYAFSKSFTLIKNNWWLTFGTIFVVSLIVGFAGAIVQIPISILTVSKMLLKFSFPVFPIMLIFGLLANLMMLFYCLMAIAISLCYFSYSERKDGTGLLNRIDMLGQNNETNPDQPTEQY